MRLDLLDDREEKERVDAERKLIAESNDERDAAGENRPHIRNKFKYAGPDYPDLTVFFSQ